MQHASMERDEVYVPITRSELDIPDPEQHEDKIDYDEIFGDTPLFTLYKLVRQQLLAFPAYLRKGSSVQSGKSCFDYLQSTMSQDKSRIPNGLVISIVCLLVYLPFLTVISHHWSSIFNAQQMP